MIDTNNSSKLIGLTTVLAVSVVVGGCNQSTARRDSIAPSFGNAMAANTALQTVDPWPRNVEDTHIHTDGTKATNAIERYHTPVDTESTSSTSAIEAVEIAPKT